MSNPMDSRPFESYDEAMDFLFEFVDFEKINSRKYSLADFDLRRTVALLESVGSPQDRLRMVHTAGTKGKGSTCMLLRSQLTASGYCTGLFTSPHLVHLEERVSIDGTPISKEDTCRLLGRLRPYADRVRAESPADSPSFFELTTAMAFLAFEEKQTGFAVIEVGMGGRLDSTNVITPRVSIITRVDYDHVRRLGPTLAHIAREKAGIVKPGVPVVCATQAPEAMAVIAQICDQRGAPLRTLGVDFAVERVESALDEDGARCRFTLKTPHGRYEDLVVPAVGEHQAVNASLAVAALELLHEMHELTLDEPALRQGLGAARLPARIEVISGVPGAPLTLLDGAHNRASMQALRSVIDEHLAGRRMVVVFAIAADKEVGDVLAEMLRFASHVVLTRSESPRALPPDDLLARVRAVSNVPAEAIDAAAEALERARELAGPDDVICVTGSLYLAGLLRPILLPGEYPGA